jgi:hypothetical protein
LAKRLADGVDAVCDRACALRGERQLNDPPLA